MKKQFPDPIIPPKSVAHARTKRRKEVMTSVGIGILIRLLIVLFEFVGVYFFGSSALLLDALSSTVDIATSLFFILCIRYAAKPPDKNHPFGHGRLEPLIGLQMGLLLAVLGSGMIYHQLTQIADEVNPEAINSFTWIFPLTALILLELTYRVLIFNAKKHDSPALAADAAHYRMDSLTSLLATIVLIIGVFYPNLSHLFDHVGALLIASIMIWIGFKAALENVHQLLDRAPPKKYFKLVDKAAKSIEGVLGTEKIRIQQYGPDAHVDIDIEVDPFSTVEIAHCISQKVRVEIQKSWPAVRDVTVHIEPYYPDDH